MSGRVSWRAVAVAFGPAVAAAPCAGWLPDSAALVVLAWAVAVVALTTRPETL